MTVSSLDYQKLKCSKISNTFLFLFSNKLLVIKAGIHKMLVRIANREDPDQNNLLGLHCLMSRPFWHATLVLIFFLENHSTVTLNLNGYFFYIYPSFLLSQVVCTVAIYHNRSASTIS